MSASLIMEPMNMPLAAMSPRSRGTIRAIAAGEEESERLAGLGLCVGRNVELIKTGHTMILRVYGTQIGLSHELASAIEIEPEAVAAASPDFLPAFS